MRTARRVKDESCSRAPSFPAFCKQMIATMRTPLFANKLLGRLRTGRLIRIDDGSRSRALSYSHATVHDLGLGLSIRCCASTLSTHPVQPRPPIQKRSNCPLDVIQFLRSRLCGRTSSTVNRQRSSQAAQGARVRGAPAQKLFDIAWLDLHLARQDLLKRWNVFSSLRLRQQFVRR